MILHKSGQLAEAARLLQETMGVRVEVFGEDHPDTLTSKRRLEAIVLQQSSLS